MRKKKDHERGNSQLRKRIYYFGAVMLAVKILIIGVILSGCTEDTIDKSGEYLATAGVVEVFPANFAESVEVNPVIGVVFNPGTPAAKIAASSLTLKNGPDEIPGKVTVSGSTALFTYDHDLKPNSQYTATLRAASDGSKGDDDSFEYSWKFKTGNEHRNNSLIVVSVDPANQTKNVPVGTNVSVTLNREVKSWMAGMISVTLQSGSTSVAGLISVSDKVVKFDPSSNLSSNTVYTGKFTYGPNEWINSHDDEGDDDDDDDDDKSTGTYVWTFTTAGDGATTNNDVTPPVVTSVAPANNATSVATGSTVTATFSEPMNPSTISSSTFSLKQGSTTISGVVTYSGNVATLSPSATLAAGTAFTATVSTGVRDAAGNALASAYSWSFTTSSAADITPPTVVSVTPANNATSVATNSKVTASFSEAMNSGSVSSTTFTLKQGNTSVEGTVTYSGTVATFTPAAALSAGAVYTATVTTGVKDAADNSMASNYTWSFTTVAAPAGVSFASEVAPILINKCNGCHTHKWTVSSNASTFYNNLANAGYVSSTNPTSGQIYLMLNSGHASSIPAERTKVLTWINEGSKNN